MHVEGLWERGTSDGWFHTLPFSRCCGTRAYAWVDMEQDSALSDVSSQWLDLSEKPRSDGDRTKAPPRHY